jgi:hypothetical protein
MTSNQHCANHPLVAAIDHCETCRIYLCGLCANFADSAVYCEDCFKNYEADKLVKAVKAKPDLANSADLLAAQEKIVFAPPTNSKVNFRGIRLGFYSLCIGAIAWSLYGYNQAPSVVRDAVAVELERSQAELIQCLAVFADIGQQLASGNGPVIDLRCNDTTLSNRVQTTGEEIRIVHPNPKFYGAKAIYVTDKNPVPIIVTLAE